MIVVDAGAWVRALVDKSAVGDRARHVLRDDPEWAAPAHAPIEALRTIRCYENVGLIATEQAGAHATEVREAEVRYTGPERWLLAAVWELRHNVSPYDAPFVALAQHYDSPLVTFDELLARAAQSLGVDVFVPTQPKQ